MLVGKIEMPLQLNKTSLAIKRFLLTSSLSLITLIASSPTGVAACESPKRLAKIFEVIRRRIVWLEVFKNIKDVNFWNHLVIKLIIPVCKLISKIPRQNVIDKINIMKVQRE